MISVKVTKTGTAELDRLSRLIQDEKLITEVVAAAAEPIAQAAKQNIQKESGRTADQIRVWIKKTAVGAAMVLVGIPGPEEIGRQSRAFIGRFLEFGTSKRRAHPWMRPAVDQQGGAALLSRIAAGLRARLGRAA